MRPIYVLTIRQLTGKWRLLILLALAAVPPLLGLIATAGSNQPTPSELDDTLLDGLVASAVLPIVVLAVATAALGNELEDKTLSNLTMTPLARWRIVLAKLLAALTVAVPPLVAGTVGGVLVAFAGAGFPGAGRAALAAGVGVAIGALLYSTVFLWAGLVTSHPLAFGLLYVFVWEGLFATFVNGIKYLSIRQYTLGVIDAIDSSRFAFDRKLLGSGAAATGSAIVFVGFFLLAVRRLRTMDVP
jgi:ABC-2 type transport system permease protein